MKTFPHWVTYVVAGLTWLASLSPTLVAALGPVAPYLPPVIATAGAILAALHQFGVISPTTPSSTAKALLPFLLPLLVLGAAGAVTLAGCTTLPVVVQDAALAEIASLGVDAVMAKTPTAGQAQEAAQIRAVAQQVEAIDQAALPDATAAATALAPLAGLLGVNTTNLNAAISRDLGSSSTAAEVQQLVAAFAADVVTATAPWVPSGGT